MAPAYKLTYFNIKGIAECIRFLFTYGGIEFEDVRIELNEWPNWKSKMPFGAVPILEVDGKVVTQSRAIDRFVAKKVKLVGKDDWENLEIDAVVDSVYDLAQSCILYHWEENPAIKESRKKILFKETLPYYLERLDTIAKNNNGHLAVGRLTWADFYFTGILDTLSHYTQQDLVANYPNLWAVKNNVSSLPSIKAWIEKRPNTDF